VKSYPEVSPRTIWNFRQNNPELVIQDAKDYLGLSDEQCKVLRLILLARGVNKWLKVRRDLIAYKTLIKLRIRELNKEVPELRERMKLFPRGTPENNKAYTEWRVKRQELKTLTEVRGVLRSLCHSDRFVEWKPSVSRHVLKEMNTIRVGEDIS